ncbi:hypothetical protein [Flavobacterium ovatum]|uniref:hypothetical protein n=1 Tax=Flavobacterium ovatum TaxID=1928857 RepID=UPI00344E1DC8
MKYFYYTFLAASICFTACKNNEAEVNQPVSEVVNPFTQRVATEQIQLQKNTAVGGNQNLFPEKNSTTASSVLLAVNPPHGQPNHRCDIAEGASLNSSAKNVTSTINAQTSLQNTAVISKEENKRVPTPKGMNPPHGEPGHRCDIADGAPLNSKPATTTTSVSKSETVNPVMPALLTPNTSEVITPEGMNPPHGKDGHVCGIAVGAPLNK